MRNIDLIVVHCSATKPGQHVNAAVIRGWHTSNPRNWSDIGYHSVILPSGTLESGRPLTRAGAHVKGHNSNSIGICMVGGLDDVGQPKNNFTKDQFITLRAYLDTLRVMFPNARICGHRDLSRDIDGDGVVEEWEWMKSCPCFSVEPWYEDER